MPHEQGDDWFERDALSGGPVPWHGPPAYYRTPRVPGGDLLPQHLQARAARFEFEATHFHEAIPGDAISTGLSPAARRPAHVPPPSVSPIEGGVYVGVWPNGSPLRATSTDSGC